jgi:hypothetical protein
MRLSALSSTVIAVASLSQAMAADAPSWPPGTCVYRDLHYTNGTIICVAPHFGQICKDGVWTPPSTEAPLQEPPLQEPPRQEPPRQEASRQEASLQEVCATAQIPTNPTPPTPQPTAMCTYHGVQYSLGSSICVAPGQSQECASDSSTGVRSGKELKWNSPKDSGWCQTAQIPNPAAPPPPPASAK